VFIIVVVVEVFSALLKRGKSLDPVLQVAQAVIGAADRLAAKLDKDPQHRNIAELIIQHAHTAYAAVEQLWKSGQLASEERLDRAVEMVEDLLKVDIDVDDNELKAMRTAIETALEAAVHWNKPKTAPSAAVPPQN
jgi:hypothetical protein